MHLNHDFNLFPVIMNKRILCNLMLCLVLFIVFMLLFYNRHLDKNRRVSIYSVHDHVMDLRNNSGVHPPHHQIPERAQLDPDVVHSFGVTHRKDKEMNILAGYVHHPAFKYITNNKTKCSNSTIDYLIYIHSAPQNQVRRQAIRSTWAQSNIFINRKIRLVFFLGRSNTSTTFDYHYKQNISEESLLYGDIIQLDFIDHYRNLTYKAISVLKWITTFCTDARFVIKADDDVFVNIYLITQMLEDRSVAGHSRIILGEYSSSLYSTRS